MNVYETNLYLTANFMYLHYCGKRPETFDNYFVKKIIVYTPIILGVKRTNYGKFSLRYRGAIICNSLPNDLKELKPKHYMHMKNQRKILFDTF